MHGQTSQGPRAHEHQVPGLQGQTLQGPRIMSIRQQACKAKRRKGRRGRASWQAKRSRGRASSASGARPAWPNVARAAHNEHQAPGLQGHTPQGIMSIRRQACKAKRQTSQKQTIVSIRRQACKAKRRRGARIMSIRRQAYMAKRRRVRAS